MIILYHKVDIVSPTLWWVDVDNFYRQLLELRDREVVYLNDYDPANPKHVVITFDGIYENIYKYAGPMLKKFGYPFELFLTSDYIGKDNAFDSVEPLTTFATREQLIALRSMGGRLQWHTRSHCRLDHLTSDEDIIRELTIPAEVKALDPENFNWFAYPHGDFDLRVLKQAKVKFDGAVSCIQGNSVDRYELNREAAYPSTSFKRASIGVAVPSYNYGQLLPEAVESLLLQTRKPDKILIIDDGSTDETSLIGRNYAERYPDLIQFERNEKNLGIIQTFNNACQLLKTDYICFLGADNRFRSDYIEKTAEILDQNDDVAIAYTDFALFGSRARLVYQEFDSWKGDVIDGTYYIVNFPDFDEKSREILLSHGRNFIHGSSMYKRAAYEQVGGYISKADQPEDYMLFKRMISKGWKAERVPEPVLEYRQHSSEQANVKLASYQLVQHFRQRNATLEQAVAAARDRIIYLEEIVHANSEPSLEQILRQLKRKLMRTAKMTWKEGGPIAFIRKALRLARKLTS